MRMTHTKILPLLLSLGLLAGCSGEPPAEPSGETPAATGRFMERTLPVPEEIRYVDAFHLRSDGRLELLSVSEDENRLFVSADAGESWTAADEPWLDRIADGEIHSYACGPAGAAVFYFPAGAGEDEDAQPRLLTVDDDGTVGDRELTDYFDAGSFPQGIALSAAGSAALYGYNDITVYSPGADAPVAIEVPDGANTPISGLLFLGEDRLAAGLGHKIILYDAATGEELEQRAVDGGFYDHEGTGGFSTADMSRRAMALAPGDEDHFYFCTRSGIYRQSFDGMLTERLADASLLSLSLPAMKCYGLAAMGDGTFLILYRSDDDVYSLKRYAFDETAPTEPDIELTAWSLADSDTLRQAAGVLQQENAHVRVSLTVAGDTGLERSDLLRQLNTELLAGKGPDVLILDNLPLESFEKKGVLADLQELADENAARGEWLGKADAFRRADGAVYAVPARFWAPMMATDKETAGKLDSLSAIARLLEAEHGKDPEAYRYWFLPNRADLLIRQFYSVCAPAWYARDGAPDEAALASFLSDIKTIADLSQTTEIPPDAYPEKARLPMNFTGIDWYAGSTPMAVGAVWDIDEAALGLSVVREREGGGKFFPLPGQISGVYEPVCLLGVNAQSAQKELAAQLVEAALSQAVQNRNLGDGLPVNARSFAALAAEPGGAGRYSYKYGGNYGIYEVLWPSAPEMDGLLGAIDALDTAVPFDEELVSLLIDETRSYFYGSAPLEETAANVANKLRLRQSEAQ